MALPWLRILDAVIGVTDLARSRRIRQMSDDQRQLEPANRALGGFETRLTGVVVAALKEAFDRDARRLELERQQLQAERQRADRVLRLELLRQAGDREISRLRLIAGIGVASWIGTLLFAARLAAMGAASRVVLGLGWVLLFAGTAASLGAQSQVGRALQRLDMQRLDDDRTMAADFALTGAAGSLAPWLILAGLAVAGASVLIAAS
jgi:hypothetical protein